MGSRMSALLYLLVLSSIASQVTTAPNFWSQLWNLREQHDEKALKTLAFTWTPPPAATDNDTGSSDQVVPISGEVEQYARAGDGLSATQPDFDAFFKDGTEEEEEDREEEASVGREEYPTADPSTGVRRGEEPLRRDYEFLRQWENGQRGDR